MAPPGSDRRAVPEKIDKARLPAPYLGEKDRPVVRWIWGADRQERGELHAVIERVAGTAGTSVTGIDAPPVQTSATYADGQWRVVLLGKRPPKTTASTAIALQAWDGSSGEDRSLAEFLWLDDH